MSGTAAALDVDRLLGWLQEAVPALAVEATTGISLTQIGGGYSNLTLALVLGSGRMARSYILRSPPHGVRADRGAHDMRREFRVLTSVHGSAVPVPEPIALCEDETVLGAMFFIMEKVPGVAVRALDDAPALRDPAVMRATSEALVDGLAALHALPVTQMPIYDAARVEGYGARQVANWHARWTAARPADVPDVDAQDVFAWLAEHLPAPLPSSLLHNDWKFDNMLVDPVNPAHVNGVLDWEMATIGDPRFDLATALGYWVQADDSTMLQALALGVTTAPGCLTRAEVVARYESVSGITIETPVYWWAFGLAKVAVIVLQLYARYVDGRSRDPRFALLGGMAALLMQSARRAIERNSLVAH